MSTGTGALKRGGNGSPPTSWAETLVNWGIFIAAFLAVLVGLLLLWGFWRGSPVAAGFTRVGGETRVETALEASRFWITPPRWVVITPAGTSQEIMLQAARCAMIRDAPLLFFSSDPNRQRMVKATLDRWKKIARGSVLREVIRNERDVTRCLQSRNPADVSQWPARDLPNQPLLISRVPDLAPLIFPARQKSAPGVFTGPAPLVIFPSGEKLARVVVFAAAKAPGDPPDVAVGLALAAHMATADQQVSLVVVPRYLEADHKLENQLRKEHQVVTGGIVLGSTRVLPEHTRALLRQLLTSSDRQGLLSEIRTNLGSVGTLLGALLVLLGGGTAVHKRLEIGALFTGLWRQISRLNQKIKDIIVKIFSGRTSGRPTKKDDIDQEHNVIVWLRSGWKIAGKMSGKKLTDWAQGADSTITVFQLNDVKLVKPGPSGNHPNPEEAKSVFVRVEEIELVSEPPTPKAGQDPPDLLLRRP